MVALDAFYPQNNKDTFNLNEKSAHTRLAQPIEKLFEWQKVQAAKREGRRWKRNRFSFEHSLGEKFI